MNPPIGMLSLFATGILKVSRIAAGIRCLTFITAFALFITIGAAQSLPYIPTSIFIPESKPAPAQDNTTSAVAYIFSPKDDGVDLLALNFSSNLRTSSLSLQTLTSSAPFLDSNNTAFTPSLADNGSLIVYAGDCSSPASSEIWTFNPSPNDDASSSWIKASTTLTTEEDAIQVGPGFLGSSFSFSNILEPQLSQATTYVYGGMCPNSTSSATTSQSKATYSNQMIRITPSETDSGQFAVDPVSIKGPPIAEAGFTFTGLSPSISNHSGTVTQQINYVLLGGHTQYAFVNMSTVAIWSLPEESWSFISSIKMASSGSGNTELAVKSTIDSIDSRSGHTAVLSEDGTSLVIFGGWVGDLTQAASPQLAVLQIGASYGGNGDWQWAVPNKQPSGSGIYGHGAALLPGNVMMVYGGYSISSSGASSKRQENGTPMFLNLTSMSWTDSYTNPTYTKTSDSGNSSSTDDDTKKRLGLGLGLGLGIAAIVAAFIIYFLYRRRLRHKRTIRESAIRALAQDTSRFLPHDDEMMEHDHNNGAWYTGGPDPYMRGSRSLGYQSLQTGNPGMDNSRHSWFGAPPAQVLRKPLPRRNTYDPPSSRGAGAIHPIIEADEDDGAITPSDQASPLHDPNTDGRNDSDPFLTPTQELQPQISLPPPSRASTTPSPDERRRILVAAATATTTGTTLTTDPEVQDWMTDVEAMDALLSSAAQRSGQNSPTKRHSAPATAKPSRQTAEDDARTASSVSESSRNILSLGLGSINLGRSSSSRSHKNTPGFGVAAAALAAAADEGRGGSSSSSAPSYNTARSSFAALQAEGPSLLLGKNKDGNNGSNNNSNEDYSNENGNDDEDPQPPGSPSKSKPRRSWLLGSLRRVFSGSTPSPTTPSSPEKDGFGYGYDDGMAEASDYDARLNSLSGIAAGSGLLRRKSGRGDWEAMEQGSRQRRKGKAVGTRLTEDNFRREGERRQEEDDEEWDIEKAVEKRLVQVMFTVPREPLRVVNAEPDIESGEDVVLVDPEEESLESMEKEKSGQEGDARREDPVAEQDLGDPSPVSEERSLAEEAEKDILRGVREELEAEWEWGRDSRGRQPRTPPPRLPPPVSEGTRLLSAESGSESRKRKPSRSPVVDTDGDVFSAQAVTLERPRTRVLAMVESFESLESKSRDGSSASSPTRP
ncbi:uncharacterized protein F4822DRAFT_409683 [Hypoxylon trugodes]|uniref:uncharacterized protein n=1 Tax=Hypoxylon trugodes TaxID=326681 RepID=UPI0021914919|nr:uncharacterized protein F4822DRAFT_409683 [Hypoxylon trugodes]KAI1386332.1 hypothetical protein F4822DRAFT_409683 [Hypoxylon trugodes]